MDLKFSFDKSNPLPLATEGAGSSFPPSSGSNVLDLRVTVEGSEVVCEGLSGDGVSYARVGKRVADPAAPELLAAATRSVLARTGAALPEPLIESITGIVFALEGAEAAVIAELGLASEAQADPAAQIIAVDDALQARTGIAAGTPIRIEP
ncbi:MAG: hypothetical protein KDB25_07915 [Leucobacter sp.]|nr:hypothetical protein [Leucobacter sp.]